MPTVFIRADYTKKREKRCLVISEVIWPHDKWFHPDNKAGILDKLGIAVQKKLGLPADTYEISEISLHLNVDAANNYVAANFKRKFTRDDYLEANILAAYEQQQQTINEFLAESGD
jgi:hypothetical protein